MFEWRIEAYEQGKKMKIPFLTKLLKKVMAVPEKNGELSELVHCFLAFALITEGNIAIGIEIFFIIIPPEFYLLLYKRLFIYSIYI